jgi:hypothetical protein
MSLAAEQLIERIRSVTEPELTFLPEGTLRCSARGETVATWLLGSQKIGFEAVMALDASSLTLTYWEMLAERSAGITAGFFMRKYAQGGTLRSESGSGRLPSGGQYRYDFGAYRDRVRELVTSSGWQFRTALRKP